ncbi:uncharacterized protein P7C70_g2157, partial [Phenoliferia sp. Uapishka_3]
MSLPTHRRQASSTQEKESLMSHLIPEPTHAYAPRRTASTAVLVLFATTILFIALGGVGGGITQDAQKGVEWMGWKSVEWGGDGRVVESSYSSKEDAVGVYGSETDSEGFAAGSTSSQDGEEEDRLAQLQQAAAAATTTSVGTFAEDVATRVNALVADGSLARYVWHEQLTEARWSKGDDSQLVVVGDIHGQHESLSALLSRVSLSSSSTRPTLIHTGDIVSKAPLNASLATVTLARQQSMKGVRGNHEHGVIQWREWMLAYGRLVEGLATPKEDVVDVPLPPKKGKSKSKGKGKSSSKGKGKSPKGSGKSKGKSSSNGKVAPSDEGVSYLAPAGSESDRADERSLAQEQLGARKRAWWNTAPAAPVDVESDGEDAEDTENSADEETTSGGEDLEDSSGKEMEAEDEAADEEDAKDVETFSDDKETSGDDIGEETEEKEETQETEKEDVDRFELGNADSTSAAEDGNATTEDDDQADESTVASPSNDDEDTSRVLASEGSSTSTSDDNTTSNSDEDSTSAADDSDETSSTTPSSEEDSEALRPFGGVGRPTYRPNGRPSGQGSSSSISTTVSSAGTSTFWSDKDESHGVSHASLASEGALVGSGWEWLELDKVEAKMLGVEVPEGWEWGGDWFEIARHLSLLDYSYIAALPLTLHVESLASYVVHAGMLPWHDTRDALDIERETPLAALPSTPLTSTSFTTFSPSSDIEADLVGPQRSLLLQEVNTAPFTLLNMRGVRSRGKVYMPQGSKSGRAWHWLWNDFWEKCERAQRGQCEKVGILYGHWAGQGLTVNPQSIGLDSGCAAGNRLSAFVIPLSEQTSSPLSATPTPTSSLDDDRSRSLTHSTKLVRRAWGWGSKAEEPKEGEEDATEVPDTPEEAVEEEVKEEAAVTEASEDAVDDDKVEVVDIDTRFEEEKVTFQGVEAWVYRSRTIFLGGNLTEPPAFSRKKGAGIPTVPSTFCEPRTTRTGFLLHDHFSSFSSEWWAIRLNVVFTGTDNFHPSSSASAAGVSTPNVIVGLAIFYGGFVQVKTRIIIAGQWEFAVGNTFGATVFTSYGAFWISFAFILSPWSGIAASYTDPAEFERAIGFFLLAWLVFTVIVFAASLRSSVTLCATVGWLVVTFSFLVAGQFVPSMPILHKLGGVFGIITSMCGFWTMAAGLLTPETAYFVIPVGDLSRKD